MPYRNLTEITPLGPDTEAQKTRRIAEEALRQRRAAIHQLWLRYGRAEILKAARQGNMKITFYAGDSTFLTTMEAKFFAEEARADGYWACNRAYSVGPVIVAWDRDPDDPDDPVV